MKIRPMNRREQAARASLRRGWSVIPVSNKKPLVSWAKYQSRLATKHEVFRWFRRWPEANLAAVTGAISGIVALDIDRKHGGIEALAGLEKKYGDLPKTPKVRTGGGGFHFYFKHPGFPIKNATIDAGVEVKADGGSITLPPSVHSSGKCYRWELHPDDCELAVIPKWILSEAKKGRTKKLSSADGTIPEGQRNSTLTSIAGDLRKHGRDKETILAVLKAVNGTSCSPPLGKNEVAAIAASIGRYSSGSDPCEPLPVKHISEVKHSRPEYLIDQLLIKNTVGYVSAQPGSLKTWLTLELAVAVASGTRALGRFETKKGCVLAFNAEDNPETITKSRVEALAKSRGLKTRDLNLKLIDVNSLQLDDPDIQKKMKETLRIQRPDLLILDPLRQVHQLNEDKSSDMAPLLEYLRSLQKEFGCTVMLVCHDRKPGKRDGDNHASMTRGSNVIQGWRDWTFHLEKKADSVRVRIYQRAAEPQPDFHFELTTLNKNRELKLASLTYTSETKQRLKNDRAGERKIVAALKRTGPLGSKKLCKAAHINNSAGHALIKRMVDDMCLERFEDKDGLKKIRFRNPTLEEETK
ncbi:MAG: bifunctional DNA primase/polymerase [Candidatus Omnitrophota bacterium]|jgi:hypothetical protein